MADKRRPLMTEGRPQRQSTEVAVYIVERHGRLEVFDDLHVAEVYAAQDPSAAIITQPLRRSADEAVVIYDRRAVVHGGQVLCLRNVEILEFYDRDYRPPTADVEVYEREPGEWHVVGFGTNRRLLATRMAKSIAAITSVVGDSPTGCRTPAEVRHAGARSHGLCGLT
jgi:hypothetical protein